MEVEVELVALVQVVVDHRRQQVVGSGDGVEVAGEVQVEQLHRDDLAVAAAGGAALDAERRAHRRLAQADRGLLADVLHRLAEADRGGGLAFAERRRRDRGDHDVLRLRPVGQLVDRFEPDLGQIVAVGSSRCGPIPICAAISVSGASVAARAMSRSDGKAKIVSLVRTKSRHSSMLWNEPTMRNHSSVRWARRPSCRRRPASSGPLRCG